MIRIYTPMCCVFENTHTPTRIRSVMRIENRAQLTTARIRAILCRMSRKSSVTSDAIFTVQSHLGTSFLTLEEFRKLPQRRIEG